MLVSNFDKIFDTHPKSETVSWGDFVRRYTKHIEIASKEHAAAISPAEWPVGSRRQNKSVLRVHFAALDLDKISDDVLEHIRQVLAEHQYFAHTTFSHAHSYAASGLNCLRAYLPLSRPVEIHEWPRFWKNLNGLVGNVMDPACKDASRIYLIPSMPVGSADLNFTIAQEGKCLEVDDLMGVLPVEPSANFVSHASFIAFAKSLKYKPDAHRKELGELLLKVANGEVFAHSGARDATLFKVCAAVAEKWPKAHAAQIASLFKESLRKMKMESDDAPSFEDVVEKLERKQKDQPTVQVPDFCSADILDAFGGRRDTPYTEDELEGFATESGIPRSRFNKRWIVRKGDSCYLFLDGQYGAPVSLSELVDAAKIDLSPAATSGVELYRVNQKGQIVAKNERDLLADYSTLARKIVSDLAAQKSTYDWTQKTLVEAPCPLRPLEPTFSNNVHNYLALLGGKSKEQLFDWISLVTKLDKPCAALFLYGAPGTGKSLLAMGLTRLWTLGAPTQLKDVFGDFNDALSSSPLVVADERIPNLAQKEGGSADLRSLIQEYSRPLKRKFQSHATLLGALRLIISANNKNALAWKESLNMEDIQAIRDRILSINVGPESALFLRELGEERETFVNGDEIAKHALWLRDNREVKTNVRFLVQGNDNSFHDSLVSNTTMGSAVLHWLTCYLQDPAKMDSRSHGLIRIFEGQVLVTAKVLVENWETYPTNIDVKLATIHKISSALASLSEIKKKQLTDASSTRTNFWRIETKYLLSWNRETGYASEEEILNALSKDTDMWARA